MSALPRRSERAPGAAPGPIARFGPRWAWVVQTIVFLGGGPLFLFPGWTFPRFLASPPTEPIPVAHDAFALLGVHATSIGLFTLFALMTGDGRAKRRFCRSFTVFLGTWAAALVHNVLAAPGTYGTGTIVLIPIAIVIVLVNAWWAFRRVPGELDVIDFGTVASAPDWTWPAWLLCALGAAIAGIGLVFVPDRLLPYGVESITALDARLACDQLRFAGAYLLGYAALSVDSARTDRAALRRPLAGLLAVWPLAVVLLALVRWDPSHYTWPAYAAVGALGLIGVVAIAAASAPQIAWAEDVSLPIPGWQPTDLVAGPMMGAQTIGQRRRASHLVGVGAKGTMIVPEDPRRPPSAFFTPGKTFDLVARFANLTEKDDGALDVRGGSISIVERDGPGRFDMVMNTGSAAPLKHVVQFAGFVASKFLPTFGSELIVKSNRLAREGGIVGLRRAPESYARLYYHSQIVRWWFTPKGELHLARYRLAPHDLGPESGLPDAEDAKHIWLRGRRSDCEGGPTYLRRELPDRLAKGPVRFRFQAQLRPSARDLDLAWYDASVDWPEDEHPWVDVGLVELTEPLSHDATEVLTFSPLHHPADFGIPPSASIFDLRSLGDSEVRVMSVLARLRHWMYRRGGLPRASRDV